MVVEHNRVENSALPLAINPHFTQVSPNQRVVKSRGCSVPASVSGLGSRCDALLTGRELGRTQPRYCLGGVALWVRGRSVAVRGVGGSEGRMYDLRTGVPIWQAGKGPPTLLDGALSGGCGGVNHRLSPCLTVSHSKSKRRSLTVTRIESAVSDGEGWAQ